jgi:chromosome segregation ATPase
MKARFELRLITKADGNAELVEHVALQADSHNEVVRPATDDDRHRWRAEYEAFKAGGAEAEDASGTLAERDEALKKVAELAAALEEAARTNADLKMKLEGMAALADRDRAAKESLAEALEEAVRRASAAEASAAELQQALAARQDEVKQGEPAASETVPVGDDPAQPEGVADKHKRRSKRE